MGIQKKIYLGDDTELTSEGEKIVYLEDSIYATHDEQPSRFTREQVVYALCRRSNLCLIKEDIRTAVTTEIGLLLEAEELIQTEEGRAQLFIPKNPNET